MTSGTGPLSETSGSGACRGPGPGVRTSGPRRTVHPALLVLCFGSWLVCCFTGRADERRPPDAGAGRGGLVARTVDLETAKHLAETSSHRLKESLLRLEALARLHKLGVREFLPTVEIGYAGSDTVITGSPDSRSKNVSLTVRQPILSGTGASRRRRLASLELLLDRRSYEKLREEVLDEACRLFYRLALCMEKAKLQDDVYELACRELEIAEAREEAGAITRMDLVEIQLEVRTLELEISATSLELQELEYLMRRSLGIPPEETVQWEAAIDRDYAGVELGAGVDGGGGIETDHVLEDFCTLALANNLELRRGRLDVQKLLAESRAGLLLPRLEVEASFGVSGDAFPLQQPGYAVSVIVSFPTGMLPIDSSVSVGRQGSAARSLSASGSAAVLQDITPPLDRKLALLAVEAERRRTEELTEEIVFSVRREMSRCRRLRETLEVKREYRLLEDQKVQILEQQLELGEIKRIDLLRARTSCFRSEMELLEDVMAVLDSERALERLLGMEPGMLGRAVAGQGGARESGAQPPPGKHRSTGEQE